MAERLFWRYPSDEGAWTFSSAQGRFPGTNLLDQRLSAKHKTTGAAAAESYAVDLGADYTINAFAFLNHDLDGMETGLLLEGDSGTPIPSAPEMSEAVTYRATNLIEFFSTDYTVRYLDFGYAKAAAADIRSAGRLVIGSAYTFPRGSRDQRWSPVDLSDDEQMRTGQMYVDVGAHPRVLRLTFPPLTEAQAKEFDTMARTYAMDNPVIYSRNHDTDPTGQFAFVYGMLRRPPQFQRVSTPDAVMYTATLEILEVK